MPDVNVLVYAHRHDVPEHAAYEEWLRRLAESTEPFALSALVAVGLVRIVTNRRIYPDPSPVSVAVAFIEELLARPNCRLALPGADHFSEVARLCRAVDASGPRVADAQHAAIAISNGSTWVTADADFAQFAAHGLRWQYLAL